MSEPQDAAASEPTSDDDNGAQPYRVDPSRDPHPGVPDHLAPDDVGPREWVDANKDPTPAIPAMRHRRTPSTESRTQPTGSIRKPTSTLALIRISAEPRSMVGAPATSLS